MLYIASPNTRTKTKTARRESYIKVIGSIVSPCHNILKSTYQNIITGLIRLISMDWRNLIKKSEPIHCPLCHARDSFTLRGNNAICVCCQLFVPVDQQDLKSNKNTALYVAISYWSWRNPSISTLGRNQ